MTELDIEAIAEIAARAVLKVLAEQASQKIEKPEPLEWQSVEVTARALGINRSTLNRKKSLLRLNQDYRLVPGTSRWQYHVENCQKKLKTVSL